ncbi:ArnT family glycosyltransferase [Heliorestis convoluta]|uniref:Dolichyl-phosphate-mannose--protein mannosyltransferase n=1 Tax=Heliorestis convoluta TaxID=356322 RepID=A0A5Q2N645_9FIRM|nr:glycosyltransferase family 39 protein [Heliorestis convoluta]QGG49349.1 dolichyl-phosphate-mannose--protein mannosyltransferase [Heliorestis convoluta]
MFRRIFDRAKLGFQPDLQGLHSPFAPWLLGGLLFVALLLRLQGIDVPFADFHSWRQSDTAAVARHFYELEMNILRPQLHYYGAPPNYAELEFGLLPFITALLYHLWGGEAVWIARSVVVLFSIWSILSIYRIAHHFWGTWASLAAAFVLALHPTYVYFSRSYQPDVPMIALALAGLANFLAWRNKGSLFHAVLGCFWLTLAVLVKPPALIFYFPLAIWWFYSDRNWYIAAAYLFFPIAFTAAYIWSIHGIAQHPFVSGLTIGFAGRLLEQGIPLGWFNDVARGLFFYTFTPALLLPVLVGLWRAFSSDAWKWILPWIVGLTAFFMLAGSNVLNLLQYYYLVAIPLVALLVAAALSESERFQDMNSWIWRQSWQKIRYTVLFWLFLAGGSYLVVNTYHWWLPQWWLQGEPWRYELWYNVDEKVLQVGSKLDEITDKEDLLLIVEGTPRTLFHSRRFGWFIEPTLFNDTYLERARAEGAAYLVWMDKDPPPYEGERVWHEEGFWLVDVR